MISIDPTLAAAVVCTLCVFAAGAVAGYIAAPMTDGEPAPEGPDALDAPPMRTADARAIEREVRVLLFRAAITTCARR